MTTVTYRPEEFYMKIDGHAGFAPAGQDLVCAAVTILGWTLIDGAQKYKTSLHLDDGVIELRCYPEEEQEESCRVLFDTIARGCELMAEKFPAYIKMGGYYGDE